MKTLLVLTTIITSQLDMPNGVYGTSVNYLKTASVTTTVLDDTDFDGCVTIGKRMTDRNILNENRYFECYELGKKRK